MTTKIGFVAIGRNEGEHLRRCLQSIVREDTTVVYVDSGSTDDSRSMAINLGVSVVELDLSIPFTAARARNAGFDRLMEIDPDLEFIHFIDGDCHIEPGWLELALSTIQQNPKTGAVFGKRCELHPDASPFNSGCHLEWNTPLGGRTPFGGEVLMRVDALKAAGFYNPQVIASEDFELWIRMNKAGWNTQRIDAVMSWHDARILHWKQWWKRSERTGHAYGQVPSLHEAQDGFDHHHKAIQRTLIWGLCLPLLIIALLIPTKGVSLLGLGLYALSMWRGYKYGLSQGWKPAASKSWAMLNTLAKIPEAKGLLRWYWRKLTGKQLKLIEYKEN